MTLKKILIANRGEIAVRIIRACRDMRLGTVAVYSDADREARHVRMADEAYPIGGSPPADSYLRIDRIMEAARRSRADAVHPGYGFLSENAGLAAACRDAGVTFVGPSAEAIALMGSKTAARQAAAAAGVPVVPGVDEPIGPDADDARVAAMAESLGYPLLVKAVAGGGGKGMRLVREHAELGGAIRAARSEAQSAFGDPSFYLERRLERPRHVEVQLLADTHGTVVPFVERECSIQRRHQKVIEETPSPVVTADLRRRLTRAAVEVARRAGYTSAGTVEFLLDADERFYFLEMNTRLQVEHAITEAVTGIDLVEWQLRIAAGERLAIDPAVALVPRGHAVECRVYAEDAEAGFIPCPGRITSLREPGGPGIRIDGGIEAGGHVPVFYDPLIAKLTAWGRDRPQCLARLRRALQEYDIRGIRTTIPFFAWLLAQPAFERGEFHTGYLDEVLQRAPPTSLSPTDPSLEEVAAIAGALLLTLAGRGAGGEAARGDAGQRNAWADVGGASRSGGSPWARHARRDALRT